MYVVYSWVHSNILQWYVRVKMLSQFYMLTTDAPAKGAISVEFLNRGWLKMCVLIIIHWWIYRGELVQWGLLNGKLF